MTTKIRSNDEKHMSETKVHEKALRTLPFQCVYKKILHIQLRLSLNGGKKNEILAIQIFILKCKQLFSSLFLYFYLMEIIILN